MTDQQNYNHINNAREAGTEIPASLHMKSVISRKESPMNKFGYFLAGVVTGAVGLTIVAFLTDDVASSQESAPDCYGDEHSGQNHIESVFFHTVPAVRPSTRQGSA